MNMKCIVPCLLCILLAGCVPSPHYMSKVYGKSSALSLKKNAVILPMKSMFAIDPKYIIRFRKIASGMILSALQKKMPGWHISRKDDWDLLRTSFINTGANPLFIDSKKQFDKKMYTEFYNKYLDALIDANPGQDYFIFPIVMIREVQVHDNILYYDGRKEHVEQFVSMDKIQYRYEGTLDCFSLGLYILDRKKKKYFAGIGGVGCLYKLKGTEVTILDFNKIISVSRVEKALKIIFRGIRK